MHKVSLKTPAEIEIMKIGGAKLAWVRDQTIKQIKPGVTGLEINSLATKLIEEVGGTPSFSKVKGYKYATCININDGVVHSIPTSQKLKSGDVVSLDVGLCFNGFHTDTSISIPVGKVSAGVTNFLNVGKLAVKKAIDQVKVGNRIWDLSNAMQTTVEKAGHGVVTALTGHGIGKYLHEKPAIPCFVAQKREHTPKIVVGMVLAIEIMYALKSGEVCYKNKDGWTIVTADGKIAGLFEQTVAVTDHGPLILTQ
ncbi:MAG: type I methionyl aminopeptidase [Patescibacteria group bacterium]